ncbi:S66 family peptidase [Litorihabitans aurantiacus]|uniref:LD-carboxypeptidase n=1 Tax=Litorihabitans aurantiacus TaxID=1930061 RepID=A0AA37UQS3_9MICO|nr:S66 peptidase family protein [Litorihabitans aurantiacus]GMA31256.1 LD-carboxypeptidase [Litorihabitans aurantiacus]
MLAPTTTAAAAPAPDLRQPPKASPGDRVAVLSPSFAAPGFAPAVHEQAMRRLEEATGLVPVEYPTTRQVGADPRARAHDLEAAFTDLSIRAVLASVGGDDQITVTPHLDPAVVRADPKPFLGYSDNTHLLHWLAGPGVAGFYGGSTQVHRGPGPGLDDVHVRSLRAALIEGGALELTDPGESEDLVHDWLDPRALTEHGDREPTAPWSWHGPETAVSGPTWGGCLEVVEQVLAAGRMGRPPSSLRGHVLLLETSEELPDAGAVSRMLRNLGERGILGEIAGVLAARPPVSSFEDRPDPAERERRREAQREAIVDVVTRYNPGAVVCVGVPFGHTRPQWIVPYGGTVTLDGVTRRVSADYGPAAAAS